MDVYENENIKFEVSLVNSLPISFGPSIISKILNISRSKAYLLANSKVFPILKIGTRTIIMRDDFLKWLKSNKI